MSLDSCIALVCALNCAVCVVGWWRSAEKERRTRQLFLAYRRYAHELRLALTYYENEYGYLKDADAPVPRLRIEL